LLNVDDGGHGVTAAGLVCADETLVVACVAVVAPIAVTAATATVTMADSHRRCRLRCTGILLGKTIGRVVTANISPAGRDAATELMTRQGVGNPGRSRRTALQQAGRPCSGRPAAESFTDQRSRTG
jgi:hypothetical protein